MDLKQRTRADAVIQSIFSVVGKAILNNAFTESAETPIQNEYYDFTAEFNGKPMMPFIANHSIYT
jgi:hypothetical protein